MDRAGHDVPYRWPLLDGLRGVAILLVVAAHVGLPGGGGAVGVTLFFVLSGFLITNLLIRELDKRHSINRVRFYSRRAYRLVPGLAVYLIGAGVIAATVGMSQGWIWNETWPAALYVTNYTQIIGGDLAMNWHTWSLAVEEHFYLIWPLALVAIPAVLRSRYLAVGTIALAVWSLTGSALFPEWSHYSTDGNAFALAAGCWVAVSRTRRDPVRFPSWIPMAGVLIIVASSALNAWGVRQVLVVGVASVTIWACAELETGLLGGSALRYLGRISYGVYLWHVPLLMVAGLALGSRVLAAGLAVVVASASWFVIERPALRVRDRRQSREALVWGFERVARSESIPVANK